MRPALVVFMHGLGDTPHGWADTLREAFRERLPHVRFELPEAPRAAVTCNGGAKMTSWMDLREIPVTADAYDDEPTLVASVARVHAVIGASGVPPMISAPTTRGGGGARPPTRRRTCAAQRGDSRRSIRLTSP
jgi:predicted esterase